MATHAKEETLLEIVQGIFERVLNQVGEEIDTDTSLSDDLLVTSEDRGELATALEDRFKVDFSAADLAATKTVEDVINLIKTKIKG